MLAWRFHQTGPIENLQPEEVPLPEPRPGEALVRIQYAALNPADRYLVQGQYPRAGTPPLIPGRDGCGIVKQAGPSGRLKEGDRVVVLGGDTGIAVDGTFAEYVTVPEDRLGLVPNDWSDEEAAGGAVVLLTAWEGLVRRGKLQAGETVLVTGASGGVGTATVLLAKALGARVFALSRSEEKRGQLEALGADESFDSEAPDIERQVKEAAGDTPVSLVIENLGGPWLQRCINMAGYGGRIMIIGLLAGLTSEIKVGLLIHKCIQLQGMSVSAYDAASARGAWEEITAVLGRSGQRPPIDAVYGKDQPQEAFARLAAGPMGKVLADFRG